MDSVLVGITLGGLYGLVALAFVLTFQTTRTLNFALGEFITAGGFAFLAAVALDLPAWLAVVIAVLVIGLLGMVTERIVVRPFNSGPHDIRWFLTTAGLSLIMLDLLRNSEGSGTRALNGIGVEGFTSIAGTKVSSQFLLILALAIGVTLALTWFTQRTTLGTIFRAVAEDRETASLMGLSPGLVALGAYAIAMSIAAAAGIMYSAEVGLSIGTGQGLLVAGFAAAILGGLDSIPGAMVGGLAYGVSTVVATDWLGTAVGGVIGLVVTVLVLAVRPQGLLGRVVMEKV
ncbi:branched-chain amino acid ABC transporter permease [Aeromicrobium wangtongii]|uniref:Branched-chain amino acid ABC transporter permease n=1 Tax=Aeromicrobium wangtongii TaxID=2969247 RepID=A0ABY5MD62_9ACTN|nr:branched-chain amino acid ABC transporter permease [Aeromicrobium wangtongii]MCD9197674.1 branched-chain amino acid ABC transporter permease [Aeromicrobium wangtongii]UUP15159.1 branched-chain amino acid ABC transporter permease [Aeromicrobium wangtongii]